MSQVDYRDGPLFQRLLLQWQPPATGTAPTPCWQLESGAFVAERPAAPARPMCSNTCPWSRPHAVERAQLAARGGFLAALSRDDCCTYPDHYADVAHQRDLCWPVYALLWHRARGAEVTDET